MWSIISLLDTYAYSQVLAATHDDQEWRMGLTFPRAQAGVQVSTWYLTFSRSSTDKSSSGA